MKKELTIELYFEGIDCPNCAAKIESLLNKNENITEARLNFLSKKIILTYTEGVEIISLVKSIASKIEPDVMISLEEIDEDEYYETHEVSECHDDCCCHDHHHEHHHDQGGCCHDHDHEHHDHDCCCHDHEHDHEHHHDHDCCCHDHEHEHDHEHHHDHDCCCHDHEHHHDHEHDECCKEHYHDDDCVDHKHYAREKCCTGEFHYKDECPSYKKMEKKRKKVKINYLFFIGLFVAILGLVLKFAFELTLTSRIVFILAYLLLAYKIIIKSFKNITKGNFFDENLLMLIASIGALIIDESLEAILVVVLYTIGEFFQNKALGESTDAIASLTKLKVNLTTLKDGRIIKTKHVKVDDEIIIKAGERVPLDGVIISGETSVDTKALTGESLPQDLHVGDNVFSGCINLTGGIIVRVTKRDKESTASKIIEMVEAANNKKSKTEAFITKFSKVYTPIILVLALLVFLVEWLAIDKFTIEDALNNCFVFLVSSCPCALVISIPLSFYGGIGKCSTYGVLVKGGNYLEALAKTNIICFDKTGTLTKGNFNPEEIIPANGITEDELLNNVIAVEKLSNHPIAKSICTLKEISSDLIPTDEQEIPGMGLVAKVNGQVVLVGNEKLMNHYNINYEKINKAGSIIYTAVDNKYYGAIVVVDEIKEESYTMMKGIKKLNIKTFMLSGDNSIIAENVAKKLEIDSFDANLSPEDKLNKLETMIKNNNENNQVVYVGDGINDTPAITLADIGVAIGGFGNDEAISASDVVLMNDNMNSLVDAIYVAKYTKKILLENIIFALTIKLIALVVGTFGLLGSYGMLLGVFADVGVCILVILNTLRILKKKVFRK